MLLALFSIDITKEVIKDIQYSVENNLPLTDYQKECAIYALNKVCDFKQVPYYEVIYHDEYDRTEHRIMNPVSTNIVIFHRL